MHSIEASVRHLYLKFSVKSKKLEAPFPSSLSPESTSDKVARNWTCATATTANVADGLRTLAVFWLPFAVA